MLLSLVSGTVGGSRVVIVRSRLFAPTEVGGLVGELRSCSLDFSIVACPQGADLCRGLSVPFVCLLFR